MPTGDMTAPAKFRINYVQAGRYTHKIGGDISKLRFIG
jgi:hypothetical protein